LFVQVLGIAKEAGAINLGSVYLDGAKIKANATKRHSYSYLRAIEIKAQLEKEVYDLMKMADSAESSSIDIQGEITLTRKFNLFTPKKFLANFLEGSSSKPKTEPLRPPRKLKDKRDENFRRF
jgi:hypothetical protein